MARIALYPGTFDPITHGHIDIARRGLSLFDQILIAVSASHVKAPVFSLDERLLILQQTFHDTKQIQVIAFSGLLVELMQQHGVYTLLRGIRTSADISHEFQLADTNHYMNPEVETVFLKAAPKYAHISSTIVREIIHMRKGEFRVELSRFVPEPVIQALK